MKNRTAIWRLTKALAPPFVAVMVIGCSASDPLGPVSSDNPQPVISSDQIVDVNDVITPDKTIDASRSTDIDDVTGLDRSGDAGRATDVNDIVAPEKTSDPSRSVDVNDLQSPQLSENVRGLILDRNEVPDPRDK